MHIRVFVAILLMSMGQAGATMSTGEVEAPAKGGTILETLQEMNENPDAFDAIIKAIIEDAEKKRDELANGGSQPLNQNFHRNERRGKDPARLDPPPLVL